jgi:hypothetical protein
VQQTPDPVVPSAGSFQFRSAGHVVAAPGWSVALQSQAPGVDVHAQFLFATAPMQAPTCRLQVEPAGQVCEAALQAATHTSSLQMALSPREPMQS